MAICQALVKVYTLIGWGLFDDKLMVQQINHLILMERIGKLVRTDIYEILVYKRDFKVFFFFRRQSKTITQTNKKKTKTKKVRVSQLNTSCKIDRDTREIKPISVFFFFFKKYLLWYFVLIILALNHLPYLRVKPFASPPPPSKKKL